MFTQIGLIISVVLQFAAFIISLSLIPKTRFNIAWISISIGLMLMAFRRLLDLFLIFEGISSIYHSAFSSWLAIIISISMLIAVFYIRRILIRLNQLNKLQLDNEARLLSAIITTEEKEKKHFAKELHDGLGPILSSIKLSLSALETNNLNTRNSQILQKTENAIDNAIAATKEISNHLTPKILERYGLERAIKKFASDSITDPNFRFHAYADLKEEKGFSDIKLILYRIFCELLNNTLKHADAQQASLSLFNFPDHIVMIYEDDGIGFDTKSKETSGMGLTNIASRVRALNGKFSLSSKSGKGMYIRIELPNE